jgi:hypothetical protein
MENKTAGAMATWTGKDDQTTGGLNLLQNCVPLWILNPLKNLQST